MIAISSSLCRHAALIVAAAVSVLVLTSGANAEDRIIGELDGTHKLTADDIRNGFNESDASYITPCPLFDEYEDKYVLTVEMGEFSDHLIPRQGVTVCDLLTSTTAARKYLYAPLDPRTPTWDGYTVPIVPSLYDEALGGSAEGYVGVGGRSTLSFWGDNGNNINHTGGCCTLAPGQPAAWYRPYRLLLSKMDTAAYYLGWGAKPIVAVTNGPVVFEVNVWNMRSEPFSDAVTLSITTNGKTANVTSPTGRYTHYADASTADDTKYDITVLVLSGPEITNGKELKTEVVVVGELPWDVTPSSGSEIPQLVHFGSMGTAIGPVEKDAALNEDWFASTVVGGESNIRPVAGHTNIAQTENLPPARYIWENVTSPDGIFQAEVPCKSVQYYALAVYSAVAQRIVVQYGYDTDAVVYFAGKRFFPQYLDSPQKGSFSVDVTQGYHQLLAKLFSDGTTESSPQSCTTVSKFWLRVVGTAVGYTHAVTADIPEGAFELWSNFYTSSYLHLGNKDDYLYGGLDEEFLDMRTAVPKPGEILENKIWKEVRFYAGRLPVSAQSLPEGKEAAVVYGAFAVYSGYDDVIPVSWSFITSGKTDFFLDGVSVYSRGSEGGSLNESVATPLSKGWHETIVRIVAVKGQSWSFNSFIHCDNYRLAGAMFPGTSLPLGLSPIRPGVPLSALMELVGDKSGEGAIPLDPSNLTTASETFADIPIDPSYTPGLLSTQNVWTLGIERQYRWVAGTSTDGLWGRRAFGGNFNQYWSLALYATNQMQVAVRIVFHGGYAMWLDGKAFGSAAVTWSGEGHHDVALTEGWHQLIVKLRANDSFHLLDTKNGTVTWTKANAFCAANGGLQLCTYHAVCPLGVGRPGVIPVSGGSSFVPVVTQRNGWVQVSKDGGNETSICQSWREAHGGEAPSWGEEDDDIPERHLVPCCGGDLPPSMWLSLTPASSADGELGYTYDHPIIVEAPVLTVDNPIALTQRVTMTSATNGAIIKYVIGDATDMKEYTDPVTITESSMITAQAFVQERASQQARLFVNIPTTPSLDRATCVTGASCPLKVSGVDPGWRISLLTATAPDAELTLCRNESYARSKEPSPEFSGVLNVGDLNELVAPSLSGGTFHIILYSGAEKASLATNFLYYDAVQLTPSEVVGTQQTVFQIQGGVMDGDGVLIPFGPAGSPATCDADTCFNELSSHTSQIAVVPSGESMHISQDLYGYEGNLTCLCLCLSCSTKASNQRAVVPVRSKVVSTLINVHVWGPQTPTTVVEKKKSNGATVAAILLGLIATVLAVCLTVMCVRKYWLAREEETYRVETLDNELYRIGHDSELEVPVDVDIGVMKAVERVQ